MISRQLIARAALIAGDVLIGAICFGFLPSRSPIHWNIQGQVDGYGAPWEVAFVFPIINAATVGLLLGISRIPRVHVAVARSGTIFGRMVVACVGMLLLIHAMLLGRAFGRPIDVSMGGLIVVGLAEIVLGNWSAKLRRNQIAGFRTRWTLKSDVVWERTNRLGAGFQVAHGLVVLLAAMRDACLGRTDRPP